MHCELRKYLSSLLAVAAAMFFAGCCPCRLLTTGVRDSIRIETVVRTERVPDTVLIEVPVEAARQTVRDTTSLLESSFARSEARINTDGSLFHTLENKARKWPAAVEKEIVYRDSIIYRDRETARVVEVPRTLTWWQQTQIRACWVLLAIVLLLGRKYVAALMTKVI